MDEASAYLGGKHRVVGHNIDALRAVKLLYGPDGAKARKVFTCHFLQDAQVLQVGNGPLGWARPAPERIRAKPILVQPIRAQPLIVRPIAATPIVAQPIRVRALTPSAPAPAGVPRPNVLTGQIRTRAAAAAQADQALHLAVTAARNAGVSWLTIGDALGITPQAAEQRFGGVDDGDMAETEPLDTGRPPPVRRGRPSKPKPARQP